MNTTLARRPGRFKAAVAGMLSGWLGRPITLQDGDFWGMWQGAENYSGKSVTVHSTLQLSTAWACIRLISETLSTLPLFLYRDLGNGNRDVARRENLFDLLHTQPSTNMTAVVFWQSVVASLLLWGNAYIEKRMAGETITSLEFLMPHCVSWRLSESGRLEWYYADPMTRVQRQIPESRMWHVPAFTTDGVFGLSPIRYGANVFGNAMAASQASGETFRNGMKSPGLVTMDVVFKKEQRDEVREHVKTVSASGGVMVLEKGAEFQQLSMNPQDAELLLTLGFGVEEICRFFRVPPFMVGHGEKTTTWGTGIEQQMIGFVTFVIRPWCVRIEQSIRKDLLTPVQRQTLSAEFAIEGLLRGDTAARAAFYSVMVDKGIMKRDECRQLENLPAMGGNASVLTVQSQMVPLDSIGAQQQAAVAGLARSALLDWLNAGDPAKEA